MSRERPLEGERKDEQMMNDRREDFSKMAQGALSVASGLAEELRSMAKAGSDAVSARMELVRQDEFEAMAELARKTAETVAALEARVAALEAAAAAGQPVSAGPPAGSIDSRSGEGAN
jgi:BMFP domain-containing protein YqiC